MHSTIIGTPHHALKNKAYKRGLSSDATEPFGVPQGTFTLLKEIIFE